MKSTLGNSLRAVVAAMALCAAPALAADIFVIASYHETDACGQPQYAAAMGALQHAGFANLGAKGY